MNIRQNCTYTGIGSRSTPAEILEQMRLLATHLCDCGWILRSGGAKGADTIFEQAALSVCGRAEIFLPWKNFNNNGSSLYTVPDEAFEIASQYHPAWHACNPAAKKFHARNVQQVLGQNLDTKSKFVVCWTKDGAETHTTGETGGTGQAIRIANAFNVPVYNLYNKGRYEIVKDICDCSMMQYSDYFD